VRESEPRWRSVLETVPDGLIVIDELGSVQSCRPAAERLFGCKQAEVQPDDIESGAGTLACLGLALRLAWKVTFSSTVMCGQIA
jgi:nitrogen fixation/metabolism regulation signal transduction histidine kinase